MIEVNPNITKEYIDKYVSHEEIFKCYITNFKKVGEIFHSELRQDTNPSAGIWQGINELVYRDFATGEAYNCYNYVKIKLGLTWKETLLRIYNDLCIGNKTEVIQTIDIKPKRVVNIKIKSKEFGNNDLDFWSKYGINLSTLSIFKVKAISYYWINEHRFKAGDYAYAYDFNGLFKIYQPYSDEKWFSNARGIVQGLNQLPERGKLLFIVSSLKDVMCLYELGYYAIAPASETSFVSMNLLNQLQARFDDTIIWYDNDMPGIEAAKKFSITHNLKYIHNPLSKPKDQSDWYKSNNIEFKEFLITHYGGTH